MRPKVISLRPSTLITLKKCSCYCIVLIITWKVRSCNILNKGNIYIYITVCQYGRVGSNSIPQPVALMILYMKYLRIH